MDVNGRIIIITGASGGIGLATAKLLSSKGAKIALVARRLRASRHGQKLIPPNMWQK